MRIGSRSGPVIASATPRRAARAAVLATLALGWLLTAASASATSIEFAIQEFIGGDSEVTFTLDDEAGGAGNILITATVTEGRSDLRALFFDIADDSLIAGLSISGVGVELIEGSPIIDVGQGGNVHGGGPGVYFDVGIEVGTPGPRDFFSTVTFVIMHDTLDLDLIIFSEQLFGARTTSTGRKLRGEAPVIVPEPATAGLTALGLAMLAVAGRRRR